MKFAQIFLVILISIAAAAITTKFVGSGQQIVTHETAYDRVMRTGTLRCAYIQWPVLFVKNLQTGQFEGAYADIFAEIGKQLNLKVEWVEEVGTSNAFEGLKSGRIDAVCAPFTPNPQRARVTDFTVPVVYMPYVAMVKANDTRFDNDIKKVQRSVGQNFCSGRRVRPDDCT